MGIKKGHRFGYVNVVISGHRRQPSFFKSAVGVDLRDQIPQDLFGILVGHPAGACGLMPTAAVFQHQFADIGFRAAVENRLAGREYSVFLLQTR